MIIIGPSLVSGIGQHAMKYSTLFGGEYYCIGSQLPEVEHALVFLLPISGHLQHLEYIRSRVKNVACMTVCETETVHEDYGLLMKAFQVNSVRGSSLDSFQITNSTLFMPIYQK